MDNTPVFFRTLVLILALFAYSMHNSLYRFSLKTTHRLLAACAVAHMRLLHSAGFHVSDATMFFGIHGRKKEQQYIKQQAAPN